MSVTEARNYVAILPNTKTDLYFKPIYTQRELPSEDRSYTFKPNGPKIINNTVEKFQAALGLPTDPLDYNLQRCTWCHLTYNNKKFSLPVTNYLKEHSFFGSENIKFEREGQFIKLTNENYIDNEIFYFDPANNHKKFNFLLSYKPKELNLEEAKSKLEKLKSSNFEFQLAAYNRHGVVALMKAKEHYVLFWATPDETFVQRVAFVDFEVSAEGIQARSVHLNMQRIVNFKKVNGNCFLNREKAIEIEL